MSVCVSACACVWCVCVGAECVLPVDFMTLTYFSRSDISNVNISESMRASDKMHDMAFIV